MVQLTISALENLTSSDIVIFPRPLPPSGRGLLFLCAKNNESLNSLDVMKKEMCLWEKISRGHVLRAEDVLMCIDDEEVREMFKGDGELRAFTLSVEADEEVRMKRLMEQLNGLAQEGMPLRHAYVCFLVPETFPLLMSELQTFCEWFHSRSENIMIMWNTIAMSVPAFQTVVLCDERTDAMHCVSTMDPMTLLVFKQINI